MFCWELRTCVICVGPTPVCIIQGPLHSWSHDSILGSCTVHFSEDVGWFFLHLWGQVVVVICSQCRGLRHGVGCLFWVLAAAMRSGSSFQGRPVLVRVLIPQSRISGWLFLWSLLGWHHYLFLFGCWPFRSARSDPFWGLREVRHIERQYLTFWDLLCGRSLTEHPLIPSFNKKRWAELKKIRLGNDSYYPPTPSLPQPFKTFSLLVSRQKGGRVFSLHLEYSIMLGWNWNRVEKNPSLCFFFFFSLGDADISSKGFWPLTKPCDRERAQWGSGPKFEYFFPYLVAV